MTSGNETRLLLEEDGSLNLIYYEKSVRLLKTNILGLHVRINGIANIAVNLKDFGENKKQPRFISQALL